MDDPDRARRQRLGQPLHRGLHVAREDGGQLLVAQARVDVPPEHRFDVGCGGRAVHLGGTPLIGVLPDGLPAGAGVDVLAGDDAGADLVEPALGIDLPREDAGPLRSACDGAVAGLPGAVGSPRDARHAVSSPGQSGRDLRPLIPRTSALPQAENSSGGICGASGACGRARLLARQPDRRLRLI